MTPIIWLLKEVRSAMAAAIKVTVLVMSSNIFDKTADSAYTQHLAAETQAFNNSSVCRSGATFKLIDMPGELAKK